MATSRYDSLDNASRNTNNFTQTEQTSQRTNTNQTTTGSATRDSTTRTNEQSKTDYNIDLMSDAGRQALTQLMAELQAGGTEEQRRILEEQLNALRTNRAAQADYSRETALGDAEGLVQTTLRKALEENLPSILLAGAGAGTSGSAITALLAQDLSTRAAGEAASVGTQAVGNYGQILASLLGQEAQTTLGMEDQATQALIEALGIDQGSMRRGSETTNRQSTSNTTERTQSQRNQSSSSNQFSTSVINRTPNESTSAGNRITNR